MDEALEASLAAQYGLAFAPHQRMKTRASKTSRPLLNWVLCRGRQLLMCQIERTGESYRVSVRPQGRHRRLYERTFDASVNAFQRHASLVASLRGAGWTSVAYR